jgi:hypothetical protein
MHGLTTVLRTVIVDAELTGEFDGIDREHRLGVRGAAGHLLAEVAVADERAQRGTGRAIAYSATQTTSFVNLEHSDLL